jgi:hypothetical protein
MNPFELLPPQPGGDRTGNQSAKRDRPRKMTDIKIHDCVLPRIHLPVLKEGSLLASATAPQVVIPGSQGMKNEDPLFSMPRQERSVLMKRRKVACPSHFFPIGLVRCNECFWINAWIQFILFIPLLRELFAYTPPSLHPFNEFIDQYFVDIDEKRFVSSAESVELVRCLQGKFPQFFQKSSVVSLFEMIQLLSCSAFGRTAPENFGSEWQIVWDPGQELSLERIFERDNTPPELLIGLQPLFDPMAGRKVNKQYFSSQSSLCYDLDAFVEYRTDGEESVCYFTYLKIDGTWVQCADERIVVLRRSTVLDMPLRQGVLFHYRRVWINQNFYVNG